MSDQYDVFISHASEDKADCVQPLVHALKERGLRVWYDKDQIRLGDYFTQKMEEALTASAFAVIVLSPNFRKHWPEAELRALMGLEAHLGSKRILPILYHLGPDEAVFTWPLLASRAAAQWSDGLETVLDQICAVVEGEPDSQPPGTSSDKDKRTRPPHRYKRIPRIAARSTAHPPDPPVKPSRLARWGFVVAILTSIVALAAWLLPMDFWFPTPNSPTPELYSLRVQALDPHGRPVDGFTLRVSSLNEPHLLPDGWWQVEIPRASVPANGELRVWAEHPDWKPAQATLHLAADANPRLEIRLEEPQESIRGVLTAANGIGISGVRVTVRTFSAEPVLTDQDGHFELTVRAALDQRVRLHAAHPDYRAKDFYCYAGRDGCTTTITP